MSDVQSGVTDQSVAVDELIPVGCYLHPMENLQFRDGRPLEAGFLHRSQLPTPQTWTGAIRAALMRAVGIEPKRLNPRQLADEQSSESALQSALAAHDNSWIAKVRLRGPWLVRHYPPRWDRPPEVMLPIPATIQYVPAWKQWVVLQPLGETASWMKRRSELQPLWHYQTEPSEPLPGYLSHQTLKCYLQAGPEAMLTFEDYANDPRHSDWFATREDLVSDVRAIGIARDLDRSAVEESRIYAPGELSFPQGLDPEGSPTSSVSFYAELLVPEKRQAIVNQIRTLTFGGQGAEVAVDILPKPLLYNSFNEVPASERILLVATSPVIADAVMPPALQALHDHYPNSVNLVSACVTGVLPVSGWDAFRRCPQPNRFAAPAGSCYFLEVTCNQAKQVLQSLDSLSAEPFASQGWGTFAIGTYRPLDLGVGGGQQDSGPPTQISQGFQA